MASTIPLSLVYLLCALISLSVAVPLEITTRAAKKTEILGPQPPHFVAYSDESQFGIPSSSDLEGFNTLILSFLLASGAADQAAAWAHLSDGDRASRKADYKANGITLMVSAFGSTDAPTTHGRDPASLAASMAGWVRAFDLDGVDVDYEDFKAVAKGTAVPWLETFTTVLRNNLPAGQFVITHAPVAPWFGTHQPYAVLDASVGHLIDWYNVQFYSQGTAYTTCDTLIEQSGGDFPGTAVMEITSQAGAGVPPHKVVLGKPGTAADVGSPDPSGGGGGTQEAGGGGGGGGGTQEAGGETEVAGGGTDEAGGDTEVASGDTEEASGGNGGLQRRGAPDPHRNGFLETGTLAQCVSDAKAQGWNGGVMVWEFPDADKQWIQDVRRLSWPFTKGKD